MKISRSRYYLGALGIVLLLMMGTLWAVSAVASPTGQTAGSVELFRGDDAVTHVSPDVANISVADRTIGVRVTDPDLNTPVIVGDGGDVGAVIVRVGVGGSPALEQVFSIEIATLTTDLASMSVVLPAGGATDDVLPVIGNVTIDFEASDLASVSDVNDGDVSVTLVANDAIGLINFSKNVALVEGDEIHLNYTTAGEEGTVALIEGDSGAMFLNLREATAQGVYEGTYIVADTVTIDAGDIQAEQHGVSSGLISGRTFTQTYSVPGDAKTADETFFITLDNPQVRDADGDDDIDAADVTVVSGNVTTDLNDNDETDDDAVDIVNWDPIAGIIELRATSGIATGGLIRLEYAGDDSFEIILEHGPANGDIFAGAIPVVGAALDAFVSVPQPGTASAQYQINGYDADNGVVTFGVLSDTPSDGSVLGVDYAGTQEIIIQQTRTGDELFGVTLTNPLGAGAVVGDVVIIGDTPVTVVGVDDSAAVELQVDAGAILDQGDSIYVSHPNMEIAADFNPDGALDANSATRPIIKAESIGSVTASYTDADTGPVSPARVIVEADAPEIEDESPASGSATGVAAGTVLSIEVDDLPSGVNGSGVDADSIRFLLTTRDAAVEDADVDPATNGTEDFIVTADFTTDEFGQVTASLPLDDPDQRLTALDLDEALVNLKWWVRASDNVGNTDTSDEDPDEDGNQPYTLSIDTVPPEMNADDSYTGDHFDAEDDTIEGDRPGMTGSAQNNSIRIAFTDDLDADTVQANDFVVTVDGIELAIGNASFHDGSVFLTMVADLAADATPSVELSGDITDDAGNSAVLETITVQDGIAPDVQITTSVALSQSEVTVTITTDEDIIGDPNLRVFFGDPAVETGIAIPDPQRGANTWTYEFEFGAGDDGQYTLEATAVDDIKKPRNVGTGGTQDPSEDDSVTFQIDRTLPGPDGNDFDPGTGDEINFAPLLFFEFSWATETEEYEGDSHDNVTLTTLVLDSGDDVETNLLGDALPQGPSVNFEISMADLSVGTHTLSVNGTDDAGNTLDDDFLVEFEVTRPIFELTLGRGISHISLPRSPSNQDINAVFGDSEEVLTVFTFEGNRPLAAFRDPSTGLFAGNLDTIDAKHAYGVETEGPVTVDIEIPPLSGNLPLPTVDVIGGWNFVPVISLDDLEKIPQGTELEADVYLGGEASWSSGWTFQQGGWEAIQPILGVVLNDDGEQDIGEVLIGRGYWVFYTAGRTLTPGTTQ